MKPIRIRLFIRSLLLLVILLITLFIFTREDYYPDYDSIFSDPYVEWTDDSIAIVKMKYLGLIEIPGIYGYSRIKYSYNNKMLSSIGYYNFDNKRDNVNGIHEYLFRYTEVSDTFIVHEYCRNSRSESVLRNRCGSDIGSKYFYFYRGEIVKKILFVNGNKTCYTFPWNNTPSWVLKTTNFSSNTKPKWLDK